MHHTISSPNLFAKAQSRHRTDALKHKLVRELIGEAQTPQRTDSEMHMIVSKLIPYSIQPHQGSESLKHKLVIDLML
jgi:hypothetical protein